MRARLRGHWPFVLLLCCGIALRVLVQVTYQPAIVFFDSFTYLQHALEPVADTSRPVGYSVLLRPLLAFGDLAVVPLFHHLCGLATATAIYALLLRRGLRAGLAAVAVAPVLLDGYLLQIEQNIASDTVFLTLVTTALVLLLWHPRPGPGTAGGAALLLGVAATVRFVGAPLLVLPLLYVWMSAQRGRRLVSVSALVAAGAVPLLVYSAWTYQHTGDFRPGGNSMSARTLYARTAPLADCRQLATPGAPAYLQRLCPDAPPADRTQHPRTYMATTAPMEFALPGLPPGTDRYEALREFGARVVANQPVDVVAAVLDDLLVGFAWARYQPADAWPLETWRFPLQPRGAGLDVFDEGETIRQFGGGPQSVHREAAAFLRDYQAVVYTRGPILALGVVLPLLAALGLGRARGSGLRAPALLVAGTALTLLLAAAAYSFSWRYQLPAIPLLPWAAALGLAALTPAVRRGELTRATDDEEHPADGGTDDAAAADFAVRYGPTPLAAVVVVVAAYNEGESIGDVLDEIPRQALDLDVDVLVVDDGSADDTADVAEAHGAYLCRSGANRGQGAALRLGYRLAREGGARYLATLDADGQYDARELGVVLAPLVEGEADFVTGSRRLGTTETTDRVRHVGVDVFARVVSLLTGHRVTDTANGFRAMRVDVTAAVTLTEPQYQAAELLLGVLARGFRVVERPTTMRVRAAGTTKKGGNLAYGLRYARVVGRTWRRERRRSRSTSGLTRDEAAETGG